ncbi:MAG: LysM peptidoglycan-binding domain-containing protein [Thermoanaerobacterales bacterium]|nr:LysM peptidoglycan-binding domain-containing protein [Thermoanaerobacterales bacterium]
MRRSLLILVLGALFALLPATASPAATYTARPGDSLYLISQRFGTTVATVRSLNGLWTSDYIYAGQRLTVPDPTGTRYTVRPGDSFYLIGRKFGLPAATIMQANGIWSWTIYPGQVLYIPVAAAPVSRGWSTGGSRDLELLARLITAEADDQPYLVKVAVGAVVLNRVRSQLFPNSIPGVIYDTAYGHFQFEPVLNGWINRPPSPDAVRAARDALAGWDPTGGALYFFEPWVGNRYLHSLPVALRMGAFVFC